MNELAPDTILLVRDLRTWCINRTEVGRKVGANGLCIFLDN